MKFSLKSLDSLADKHKKVLVFDCEFWHILGEEGDKKIRFQADKDFFFTPREIGGFLLEKVGNEWKLNKPFFVTFGIPLRDIVLPISKYSTVTHETAHKLDDIERYNFYKANNICYKLGLEISEIELATVKSPYIKLINP
jgi:hypothetical protein